MSLNITLFTEQKQKELEKLAQEFIKSEETPLYDQGGQLFLARSELKKGKKFDLIKTLKNESDGINTKSYAIQDKEKLVGYAIMRGKIDLTEHSLDPILPEVRIAFTLPEYSKQAKKELELFLKEEFK
ncbi:hypothetical protein HZA97_00620 [Candidatus Woesearchaeota archaeon]|nr:hypothetical protein [Candidatus Woesearchaeota archaeon]